MEALYWLIMGYCRFVDWIDPDPQPNSLKNHAQIFRKKRHRRWFNRVVRF